MDNYITNRLERFAEERSSFAETTFELELIVDNRTDVNFRDSSFAWTYEPGAPTLGGIAAGKKFPADAETLFKSSAEGCINEIGAQFFYRDPQGREKRHQLPNQTFPSGSCPRRIRFRIDYPLNG